MLFPGKTAVYSACTSSEPGWRNSYIGQTVLALGAGLDYFMETVFNCPPLAGTTRWRRLMRRQVGGVGGW